ncbi:tRNA (uracil-5-)-methyltransferase homolog A-like [Styela clava]
MDSDQPVAANGGGNEEPNNGSEQSAEFAYINRDQFTSEAFKIEIGNIPKYFGFGECKKLLKNKLKLNPHKIKHIPNIRKIYVTFRNEEDKNNALEKLSKYEYKRCIFDVKSAKPKSDAMAVKRGANDDDVESRNPKKNRSVEDDSLSTLTPSELIVTNTTKWHDVPYEEQLTRKYSAIKDFLCILRSRLGKHNLDNEVFVWIMKNKAEYNGMCCQLHSVLPSPVVSKYRNKSEFTAGVNTAGQKTLGYRLGKYRDQTCAVEETDGIMILPDKMKQIAKKFQEFIRSSDKDCYNPQTYEGHWRQLTVKTTLSGEAMAIVITSQKDLIEEEEIKERNALKEHFKSEPENQLVSTLLYQSIPTHRGSGEEIKAPQVLFGSGFITEDLLGLKFRISPDAFFQCNTPAAEVLYTNIGKMLQPGYVQDYKETLEEKDQSEQGIEEDIKDSDMKNNVILFDVCCGTGTIGLSLASKVKHVVGIELCQPAVDDAKKNAEINDVKNVEFHCGKAEDLLPQLVKKYSINHENEIVAIVDPPRPGLHTKVIQCLRKCPIIQKIIYVSCNANSASNNFIDLCRPASNRMPGLPFLPYCAQPVDLFPQTPHCELIVYFKRTSGKQKSVDDDSKAEEANPPEVLTTIDDSSVAS